MSAIPYIHLNEDENWGEASCGCQLTHDDDGNPMMFLCPLHQAAPELLDALVDCQWGSSRGEHAACPQCGNTHGEGHKPNCLVLTAITKAGGSAKAQMVAA